jgi:hypothetical protein
MKKYEYLILFIAVLLVGVFGCATTPKRDVVPVHWFTFPVQWCGDGIRVGCAVPSKIQIGFRDDGVVMWRNTKNEFR